MRGTPIESIKEAISLKSIKMKRLQLLLVSLLVVIMLTAFPSFASVAAQPNSFGDVPYDAWYSADVMRAVELGLISGTSATTFSPNDDISYAAVVKLAACIHQLSATGAVTLTNGPVDWYSTYMDYAYSNSIIPQISYVLSDKDYNTVATRGQFLGILSKALPDKNLREVNSIEEEAIWDIWRGYMYEQEVYKMYRAGIVRGVDEYGSCLPNAAISRAEVAVILMRMMDESNRLSFSMTKAQAAIPARMDYDPTEVKGISWDSDHLFGISFLGYHQDLNQFLKSAAFNDFTKKYPAAANSIPVDMGGDEIFCVIPRKVDLSTAVCSYNDRTGEYGPFIYEGIGRPILLKCNISDLYPNSAVWVSRGEFAIEYYPQVDLAFGDPIIPANDFLYIKNLSR